MAAKMSLKDKLFDGFIKDVSILSQAEHLDDPTNIVTDVPLLNLALSGKFDMGLKSGFNQIAGPSKHFKTSFGLIMVKAFLDKDPENMVLFYDSEFGAKQAYLARFGIDTDRIVHKPITCIEELKNDSAKMLDSFEKNEKCLIFVDSIGNLASRKELDDSINDKSAADMTRAKVLKSWGRIITPILNIKHIPLIAINHTYKTMEMFSKDVVSGGTGAYYSADQIWIIGRSQDKNKTTNEIEGYFFTINIEKSRFVKEKSKFEIRVSYGGGIAKWSGMAELAEELGYITAGKKGNKKQWSFINKTTGEELLSLDDDVDTDDLFWESVLRNTSFAESVSKKFAS